MPWLLAVIVHGVVLFSLGVRFHEKPVSVKPVFIFWGALFTDDELLEKAPAPIENVGDKANKRAVIPERSMFDRLTVEKPFDTNAFGVKKRWFKDDFLTTQNPAPLASEEGRKTHLKKQNDPIMRPPAPLPPLRWGHHQPPVVGAHE